MTDTPPLNVGVEEKELCDAEPETKPALWTWENFNAPDDETNIILDGDVLKAATLPKLITRITSDATSPALLNDFLLTYRSFKMDGLDLLDALMARYVTCCEDATRVVRIRIFNVLKHWIEKFWFDFVKDCPELSVRLHEWLDELIENPDLGVSKPAQTIKQKLEVAEDPKSEKKKVVVAAVEIPRPYLPRDANVPLLECNTEEIARQLTLIEWKVWVTIKPYEFLNLAWTKKDRAKRSGNVLAMIDRFNYVSGWVSTTICMCERLKDRVKAAYKFIEIAYKLYQLNNFNGMMAIISGLNRGPVYRLKQTFAAVEAKDTKHVFAELQAVTNSEKSYASLRKAIRSVNPPTIPYLGMYLTDLTFIEEGNKDYVTEHSLPNFHKRMLTAQTIANVQTYQDVKYQFVEVPEILSKCFGEAIFTDDQLYEISEYLEPRAGKEKGERPALLVQGLPPRKEEEKGRMELDLTENPEWEPFTLSDTPENVVTNASGTVIGQTFYKIIETLTHPANPDTNLLLPLLATLDNWTTPEKFLEALILRFTIPPPKDKSDESMKKYAEELQAPTWLRVVNVLKSWITYHYYHFAENPALLERLTNFLEGPLKEVLSHSTSSLSNLISKQATAHMEVPKAAELPPDPILPAETVTLENAQLSDFDPLEIARQLSVLNSELFCKIRPKEMLATKDEDKPNLREMEEGLIDIQVWVLEELNNSQKNGTIHATLDALAMVAYHVSTFQNWHAACAIINAFNSMYHVLKSEWSKVTSTQARKFYFDNRDIFLPTSKKDLSELLKDLHPPCVPITGPYSGAIDLVMRVNTQDMLSPGVINVEKNKKNGEIIARMQRYQKLSYNFIHVPVIQGYLCKKRDVSHLVSGLGAVANQDARALILDVILTDPDFKTEIQSFTREILDEEIAKLQAEIFNLVVTGAIHIGEAHPSASIITDDKVRDTVVRAFPNCSFSTWTDNTTTPSTTINIIKTEESTECHYLLDIKEKVVLDDITTLVKLGQSYKSQHESTPLSCVMVVSNISDEAVKTAEKCKIRLLKI
eukprot:TRINITY_DN9150_c0_g1_i1.p1 TRINITY_DN9150_c0_g1~~TRINITY_DN9150_c0_g1_i1.p1  ORF type:complete len:1039 (-),score=209.18 TRINITY_DN9150_c0_g1_i1:65-3181(-)